MLFLFKTIHVRAKSFLSVSFLKGSLNFRSHICSSAHAKNCCQYKHIFCFNIEAKKKIIHIINPKLIISIHIYYWIWEAHFSSEIFMCTYPCMLEHRCMYIFICAYLKVGMIYFCINVWTVVKKKLFHHDLRIVCFSQLVINHIFILPLNMLFNVNILKTKLYKRETRILYLEQGKNVSIFKER